MTEVSQFHNLAHIFISLIGATLLLAIYYNIRRRFRNILEEDDSQKRVDKGLLYLSLSMFVWVVSGAWAYFGIQFGFSGSTMYQAGVNIFSIVNNTFLLLALFYFYYAPSFIYQHTKNIKIIIGISIVVTAITFGVSYYLGNTLYSNIKLNALPDLILSGFLSYLLLISLYKTFSHRGLKSVAVISVISVLLTFISQLPETFLSLNMGSTNELIKIVSKTSLICIFLVLATSWVIQLALTPRINEMEMKFIDWSLIQLSIPSKNINKAHIDFGSKTTQYKNLLKFAIKRKYGKGESQSILVGGHGEISNQTYISRIIENINEILNLDELSSLERKDLFTFIGEGKYRLRMIPEHISIAPRLLEEFTQTKGHEAYQSLL